MMEYERPEWKAGKENRAPTAEQERVMGHPEALAMARRLSAMMGGDKPSTWFTITSLTTDAGIGIPGAPPNYALQPFVDLLSHVGLLHPRQAQNGGDYYLPTSHTWPWVQCVLADHKEP